MGALRQQPGQPERAAPLPTAVACPRAVPRGTGEVPDQRGDRTPRRPAPGCDDQRGRRRVA
eukprot:3300198-Pyramimonas_sp.AAC.1